MTDNNTKTNKNNVNNDIVSNTIIEQRKNRQNTNNNNAYKAIKLNAINPTETHINKNALTRLLEYTNYNNIDEIIKDEKNHKDIILKLASLYIAKNATRQGVKDENLQLEYINNLQEYNIEIQKDGKNKLVENGNIRNSNKKQIDELKSIDFMIKHNNIDIGYITAKVTIGSGGHQDNVLEEIKQFCKWSKKYNDNQKLFVVLYDNVNTKSLINDVEKKYKNTNLILTNTNNFKNDFLKWFKNKHQKNE